MKWNDPTEACTYEHVAVTGGVKKCVRPKGHAGQHDDGDGPMSSTTVSETAYAAAVREAVDISRRMAPETVSDPSDARRRRAATLRDDIHDMARHRETRHEEVNRIEAAFECEYAIGIVTASERSRAAVERKAGVPLPQNKFYEELEKQRSIVDEVREHRENLTCPTADTRLADAIWFLLAIAHQPEGR
jgi:hypothetical protein